MNKGAKEVCIETPLAGRIIEVKVQVGDVVEEDDAVVILEAMKMEIPIVAPISGTIKVVNISVGQTVEENTVLAVLNESNYEE